MKVGIVGFGSFGKWMAEFLRERNFEIMISDVRRDTLKRYSDIYDIGTNIEVAKNSDIVIVAVPISKVVDVIREIGPYVKEGSLIMDITSVKSKPVKAMLKYVHNKVEVLGTHPMFAPKIKSIDGEVIILVKGRGDVWYEKVKKFLRGEGVKVVETTCEEHDRLMSIIQGLTHFVYISTARTFYSMSVDVEKTRKLMSPVYEMMLDLIARIVGQNPELYADIQMENPFITEVHSNYIEEAKKLAEIVKRKEKDVFVKKMREASYAIGDFEKAMAKSNKLIRRMREEYKILKSFLGGFRSSYRFSNDLNDGLYWNIQSFRLFL